MRSDALWIAAVSVTSDKIYLNVPFPEKDRAKGFGARWDPAARQWYVGGRTQLAAFREWLPQDLAPHDHAAVGAQVAQAAETEGSGCPKVYGLTPTLRVSCSPFLTAMRFIDASP